jgi:hypothetical protein
MQTSYSTELPLGVHGQRIEAYPSAIVTGLATAGAVQVGTLAIYDTTPDALPGKSVLPPSTSSHVTTTLGVVGLTTWDPTYPEPPYRRYGTMPVMRKGRLSIVGETALAAHTTPFVRFTVGAPGTLLGALRADDDGGNAVAAPYIQVIVGAAAGAPAIVEINL